MDPERATRSVDARIAELATTQHGVVSMAQLIELGLAPAGVQSRVRRGRLHPLHRGVYAVGHAAVGPDGRRLAAVLTCGAGAVLSHRSAADVWDLRRSDAPRIEVTVPTHAGRRRRPGITVHRSSMLSFETTTTAHGIPVTTPARTLLDLAELVPSRQLERATDQAEALRLFDLAELDGHTHHGTRAAFERDRERDAHLLLHGVRVVRLTNRRLVREPEAVARLVLALDAEAQAAAATAARAGGGAGSAYAGGAMSR